MWAWKIVDEAEDREWLSLSYKEADEWDGIYRAQVTIVAWGEDGGSYFHDSYGTRIEPRLDSNFKVS